MALDVTGAWTAGDDIRVIEAMGLPFGQYVLTCVQNCMNQLEDMSSEAVTKVLALLTDYETAKSTQKTTNLADTEGKTLVKADVLEWEVNNSGEASGPQLEMSRARAELAGYFSFCPCLSGFSGGSTGQTALIRS